jgi:hypothetical protein
LIELSTEQRLLLAEAVFWIALARLALIFVPFRFLAIWFGTVTLPEERQPAAALPPHAARQAAAIGWAVRCAARHLPFRAVCLPQAIAAKAMLNRRHIANVMHFGVSHIDRKLSAHAWLNAGDIEVTGYPLAPQFVEMTRFR